MAATRAPRDAVLGVGLFKGVYDTGEPYDDTDGTLLANANNLYFPDPKNGSGAYARPGFTAPYSLTVATSSHGQGVYTHQALDGTSYNFLFAGGKVWRQPTDLSTAPTDVTPTNIILGTAKFIYATSLADSLIVNDGVNKMWVGTNLSSTPITATVIEQQTPANVLSIGSNDVRLANTAFSYTLRAGGSIGTQATFAANATGTAVGALGQIAANTWGVILVELNSSAALVFTAAFNAGSGYASETLAIAALPARTATRWYVGYVTVRADAGAVWIAGTDAFAGGTTGNQAQTTNYYAGEGATYSVFGQPVIYTGALFVIYQQRTVGTTPTYARTTIGWSEPNQPTVGYQQTNYDNDWTLVQTGSDPLYALAATNDALYYSRQLSWGALAGAPGVNFQSTATHDVVSGNVGCVSPATVKTFLNYIWFADANGRPYRFAVGGAPEPLWLQARRRYDTAVTISPAQAVTTAFALVEPNLNVVLFAVWPDFAFAQGYYTSRLYAFDAVTGRYFGAWFYQTDGSAAVDVAGIVRDSSGNFRLCALGDIDSAATSLPVYVMGIPNGATWTDNAVVPTRTVETGWLGYDGKRTFRMPEVRVMQAVSTTLTLTTTAVSASGESASRAPAAVINTYTGRSVFTPNAPNARGVKLSVAPTTASAQWICYRIEGDVEGPGVATVEDV